MNRFAVALLALSFVPLTPAQDLTPEKKEFFENHIRPVLAQQCFACHTNSMMAGLRLDSREGLLKGGKSGPAIVPGDAEKSLLISKIKSTDGDTRMPRGGTPLTEAQIADLTKWVKDGAYWPADETPKSSKNFITAGRRNFWSFLPLKRPDPPKVKDTSWPLNNIDKFVLARLEKDDLKPAPAADRRTLLRRVTYDLTGLPPTYEEVQAFEADKSPNAYEKVVDRLLASPHYGETWARHWMDLVRYGEDDYRVAQEPDRVERYPNAYVFRDWLVKSMNEDMPYDMFVKAQLAGDLMDEKVRSKVLPGVAMNGLGVWAFNDSPPPIERADEWNDKIDATSKTFLGLTVGCARCHDHKYDPILTKDYYAMGSVFASTNYHEYPLVPKSVVEDSEKKKTELEDKEKALKSFLEQASNLYAQTLFAQTEDYMIAAYRVGKEKGATVASISEDAKLDSEMLQRWVRFLKKKPVNYSYLTPWQEMIARGGTMEQAKALAHEFYTKAAEIDKLHAKMKEQEEAALAKYKEEEKFDLLPNGIKRKLNPYLIELKGLDRDQSYLWTDLFVEDLSELPGVTTLDKRPPGLFKLADWPLEKRLNSDFQAHIKHMREDLDAFKKAMPPPYPYVYGLEDSKEPVDLKVFVRGNVYSFGEDAPRAFLTVFSTDDQPKHFTKGSGRLELAEDILAQPISTRVIANRIWRWSMGTGIVDTPSNFGVAGERPTNPELLEYLATEFVANGLSWKKLTKEILMSRTYQLSSAVIEADAAKDSDNRLYWRANRRRLEAEGIWDSLLTASGRLDLKIGGPSEELTPTMTRRGLYGHISRVFPNNFQSTFDLPIATLSAERRYTTNVPPQRLFFLNNEFVHKNADGLEERVKNAGDERAQVKQAFIIAYQRPPTADELSLAVDLMHTHPDPAPAASGMASKPVSPAKDKPPVSDLNSLCWALISSNEFLYVY
jgi:mono/diheme cytochrome c family protein